MTFEVLLKKGLGGPYYVEAENAEAAAWKGVERLRYHQTAMDDWDATQCVAEVKPCDKAAVQYA